LHQAENGEAEVANRTGFTIEKWSSAVHTERWEPA